MINNKHNRVWNTCCFQIIMLDFKNTSQLVSTNIGIRPLCKLWLSLLSGHRPLPVVPPTCLSALWSLCKHLCACHALQVQAPRGLLQTLLQACALALRKVAPGLSSRTQHQPAWVPIPLFGLFLPQFQRLQNTNSTDTRGLFSGLTEMKYENL